ncbi:MAG: excinuclease ABC subunit UvrA [Planctomycetota bacterium]|nr:excinuclease ABC subunit UvrA [Planctomycetota bacterium]
MSVAAAADEHLVIRGAAEHNLQQVDLDIPKRRLVVFTGVSGSGKSSLAFDTIYAEGQRRYVESLSAYARQFLGQLEKPKYERISGLSPTIAIEQKSAARNPRSTVGTITEIHDYLRVLWARIGVQHCHQCGRAVGRRSADEIVQALLARPAGSRILLLAPKVRERKGEHAEILEQARREGFTRVRIDGREHQLEALPKLDKKVKHRIEIVVDRLVIQPTVRARLADSVETALRLGEGALLVADADGAQPEEFFSERNYCHRCDLSFPDLEPNLFSFNSPLGACPACNGLGVALSVDLERLIDPRLSIAAGAVRCWGPLDEDDSFAASYRRSALARLGVPLDVPWQQLAERERNLVLYGSPERLQIDWRTATTGGSYQARFDGVVPWLLRAVHDEEREERREQAQAFLLSRPCPACDGGRLKPESAAVRVGGRTLPEVCRLTIAEAHAFFGALPLAGAAAQIASGVLKEVRARLGFLIDVGLEYLTLERSGPSLSGGEAQRIRLASQVGSELTGVLYVLDEPSIGLHPRDNRRLIATLERLRDLGNTVLVVEHDEETIRRADWVVDFGPGAGRQGGRIVYAGPVAGLLAAEGSLTGDYLAGRRRIAVPAQRRPAQGPRLVVTDCRANNLQGIEVAIPLGCFVCLTGVSGAGKSSFLNGILYPALANHFHGARQPVGAHGEIRGLEHIDKVIRIDQQPIGRTPRSNPATYTKVWDHIRELFAAQREAKLYGYSASRFSFNRKGGRCEACEGAGLKLVEMHFLADVFVPCEVCQGRRFNEATLRVRYRGRSIAEVLDLSVAEARELFAAHPPIVRILDTLIAVGLDYLALGQNATTLSGGEAQRIKLSRELARRDTGRTLYILDEPSTGLHFEDVRKLLSVLHRLVDAGNTVVVIEHNLDIVKTADWVIDLGPEGGARGGRLVAAGAPEDIARCPESHTGRYLAPLLGLTRCDAGG